MDWVTFAIYFGACAAAASTGAMFQPGAWYDNLDKPPWTPPNWVFPVVWTILYIFIAVAAARVADAPDNGRAMATWALQITLNVLWTPIFFGLRRLRGGMIAIMALWLAVAGTLVQFYALDTLAGLLFVPYLIWVSIATALNYSVLRRNPDAGQTAQA